MLPLAIGLAGTLIHSFAAVAGVNVPRSAETTGLAEMARTQLSARPLDARSYYALGLAAEQEGASTRAKELIARAVELNPRLAGAHLWLMSHDLRAAQIPSVLGHIDALLRLERGASPEITAVLVEIARDRQGRALVAARFANQPLILAIARRASTAGFSDRELLELLASSDLARIPDGLSTAQSLLVSRLLENRQFAEARRTWYSLAGRTPTTAVFDGDFTGMEGTKPFGWTVHNHSDVETVLQPSGGPGGRGALHVTAFGSFPVVAAEQALTLEPGPYQLRFVASGSGADAFAWTVKCSPGPVIAEAEVTTSSTSSDQTKTFLVPEDCPLQTLSFGKLRTLDQRSREVTTTHVSIVRQ